MGEEGEGNAKESKTTSSSSSWQSYLDLPRSFQESTDTAIRSARSLQQSSSTHLRSLQDFWPQLRSQYNIYEDAFFHEVKDQLFVAKQHPALAVGIALTAGLLLMRGPRRFFFRHTLGRFQSEETQFVRAEKNVKELSLSVEVMRNESKKLIERAALAEKDMKLGRSDLMNAGAHIRSLSRSAYKAEAEAADLMDLLREIPGREALKLRADVASMASYLRQQRILMDKKILKISELGVPV